MALLETPRSMPLMLAAKRLRRRRIAARKGSVTHSCYLRLGEELQLPHTRIIPPQECEGKLEHLFDHAILIRHTIDTLMTFPSASA
ncbi:hypothetical protein ACFQS1_17810 [Paractinoplanes rhizophilus]|uniref:Uncharacterized protein n=1 Tax=Paractinoplanes rhizophilus TaxID=1416877 RepID=A0ABW2HTJ9_9ACTN